MPWYLIFEGPVHWEMALQLCEDWEQQRHCEAYRTPQTKDSRKVFHSWRLTESVQRCRCGWVSDATAKERPPLEAIYLPLYHLGAQALRAALDRGIGLRGLANADSAECASKAQGWQQYRAKSFGHEEQLQETSEEEEEQEEASSVLTMARGIPSPGRSLHCC